MSCGNDGEILTIMKNCSMQIRLAHYPIKLTKIYMSVKKSIVIHQNSGMSTLTEGLNIAKYTSSISVKSNEAGSARGI
jgi:hypothetical protein